MRRYAAKAAERGVSVRTVKRWVAASREEREAALAGEIPARGAGSGGLGRADPRWAEMALEIMGEHKDESTPGKAKILQSIGPRLAARYPGEEICLPPRSTAYRWLAELERRQPTFGVSGKRRRDIAARPVAAYGKLRPTRPGEYLLMDTTRLDVFALDQLTFRWVQPELSVAGQAFFFLHELEEVIREWTACVYHHTPNDGLADPQVPGLELSPAAMFDHGVARAGYIAVPRDPDLAYEFLKTEWVPVHHYGIELRSCRYRGPALAGLAGQTSPYTGPRARGRWPVQADPDDITRVYFRRPDTRRWAVLTWEHAPAVDFPVSEEALELARKMAASKYRYPDDKQAVAALLERWNLGLGLTAAERRMALRLSREQKAMLTPEDEDAARWPRCRR